MEREPFRFFIDPYRFFFHSDERNEPAHVHIEDGSKAAKFWPHNAELARARGCKGYELSALHKLVIEHKEELMEAWNVHFKCTN